MTGYKWGYSENVIKISQLIHCELVGSFVSLDIPQNFRFGSPSGGNSFSVDMVKIRNIIEIQPTLGFTEFDILQNYQKSFACSELGRLHSFFPFSFLAKEMGLKDSPLGRKSYFSASGKIALMGLKSYTGLSNRHLAEHFNGNIHF